MGSRFGAVTSVLGYMTLAVGIELILHPAAWDVASAAVSAPSSACCGISPADVGRSRC